jgi:hypothetical protein
MKPRHAAALALVGWYWLAPPLTFTASREGPSGKLADGVATYLPLNHWDNIRAFDHAEECEKARSDMLDSIMGSAARAEKNAQLRVARKRANKAVWAEWDLSVCIASDDPRLKEK